MQPIAAGYPKQIQLVVENTDGTRKTGISGATPSIEARHLIDVIGDGGFDPVTGDFTITVEGQTTTGLSSQYATAEQVRLALEALSTVAPGDVTVDEVGSPSQNGVRAFDVIWPSAGDYGGVGNEPEVSVDTSSIEYGEVVCSLEQSAVAEVVGTTGLEIHARHSDNSDVTSFTVADSHVEVGTVGSYTEPSADCCRIVKINDDTAPGLVLVDLPANLFATAGELTVWVADASDGFGSVPKEIPIAMQVASDTTRASAGDMTILLARVTNARAGYLDKLNISGNVAASSEVTAIQNNTRVVRVVPTQMQRPATGSTVYRIELFLYDSVGNMEAPDSAPTVAVVNQAGTSRDANLGSTLMTLVSTGRYRQTYTVASTHETEELLFTFSVVEGGATRGYANAAMVVDAVAVDFTAADRLKLEALHGKLPSATYLRGTDQADGSIASADAATIVAGVATPGAAMTLTTSERTAIASAVDAGLTRTGFGLAATGLDAIPVTPPTGTAATFREMVVQTWRRFFGKVVMTKTGTGAGTIITKAADGTTTVTTQTFTETSTTQTQGAAQ